MNQVRNLILNIIWNVLSIAGLIVLNLKLFPNMPWYGHILVFVFEVLFIEKVAIFLMNKVKGEFRITPPLGIVVVVIALMNYLPKRNFRMIKSKDYKAFAFIEPTHGTVTIMYCDLFVMELLEDSPFDGSDYDKEKLISIIENEVYKRNPYHKKENMYDFSQWDGSLDESAKRINTIEKIIKS